MLIHPVNTHSNTHTSGQFRILIVEDDSQVSGLLTEILDNAEHFVESASRGRSGIEALESQIFDLLITDIALPDITGDHVSAFAKRTHPNMPAIVITAHPAEVANRRMYELGADDVLLKPFDVTDFTTVVQRHLTLAR